MGLKILGSEESEKNIWSKKIWVKKILGQKNFWVKKSFGQKKFGQKDLDLEISLSKKMQVGLIQGGGFLTPPHPTQKIVGLRLYQVVVNFFR